MTKTVLDSFFTELNQKIGLGIQPGLERISKACQILQHPEKSCPVLHIAGTNGKGTSCYYLAQMLSLSGYKVGLTISPHIDCYQERIQVVENGQHHFISEKDLLKTHEYLKSQISENVNLSYYEWSLLLALQYFMDQKVDFLVLETGLGGRWDASNVAHSLVSGIVSVGYDHMQFLGETLEKILAEKLEIVEENSHFVFADENINLQQQALEFCKKRKTKFYDLQSYDAPSFIKPSFELPRIYVRNFHFSYTIVKILESLDVKINWEKIQGFDLYKRPLARFEILEKSPLIILDGAHNLNSLEALSKHLESYELTEYDLVFGCMDDRDVDALMQVIVPKKGDVYLGVFDAGSRSPSKRFYDNVANKYNAKVVDVDSRFIHSFENHHRPILICGSLYLCSIVRKIWRNENATVFKDY